jgi:Alpha galactosidase C-terminal beta sandwich domain/Melibiase
MNLVNEFLKGHINCGEIVFQPGVITENDRLIVPENIKCIEASDGVDIVMTYSDGILDELKLRGIGNGEITVERAFHNGSNQPFKLQELCVRVSGIDLGEMASDDYFYHVENPRIYSMLAMPVDLIRDADIAGDMEYDHIGGNRWADPGVAGERIGASPYQPFPAILLGNMKSSLGLVHGTLSQRVFYHNYLVWHNGNTIELDVLSSSKALAYRTIAPGETVRDHWYLGLTNQAGEYTCMFDRYKDQLRKILPPMYGATDINRHSIVWGSWNDGIRRDIDQERLLENAEFVSENFPTVQWVQIDDGYATLATKKHGAHGLGCVYEENNGIDLAKFPEGLKVFCDKVRRTGLRPALWIGGKVPGITPLYKDHPEWFVDYDFRIPGSGILDVSKTVVREYMVQAADFFFDECGFEGMKHDFWSYVYEDSHDLLANTERSGYEWRRWWLQVVRDRLPADGYFQTGCDIVMGNPFLGEHFTNYRYGIDIGDGNWDYITTNFQWGAACFALRIGDLFVPNSDSVGLLPDLTDDEVMLVFNYCLVSGSMVELAGWLYQHPDHPRMPMLKKAMCCPNNGHDVYFPGYNYRTTHKAPEVWSFNTPHFSLLEDHQFLPSRTVAMFNLEEEARTMGCFLEELGLDAGASYLVTDVWSGETSIVDGTISREMAPHASCLLAISKQADTPKLLDANMKVDVVCVCSDVMNITFGFDGEYELLFNLRPKDCNAEAIAGAYRIHGSAVAGEVVEVPF